MLNCLFRSWYHLIWIDNSTRSSRPSTLFVIAVFISFKGHYSHLIDIRTTSILVIRHLKDTIANLFLVNFWIEADGGFIINIVTLVLVVMIARDVDPLTIAVQVVLSLVHFVVVWVQLVDIHVLNSTLVGCVIAISGRVKAHVWLLVRAAWRWV